MTVTLTRYEAARSALAECRSIDEVKDIHDKAEAMRAYGRMANDTQLEMDAAELRLRAERRLGIMITAEKQAKRLRSGPPKSADIGTQSAPIEARVTLTDIGVDKKLSARSQRVGGIADRAFEMVVANVRARIAEQSGRVSLDITAVDKKARRATRERVLAGIQCALPSKKYGVIYADPEWRFEVYSRDTGMDRAADNHYPTSGTDAICARPVGDIAADDCVLFLWATAPMMPDALKVMAAWGFTYKSQCVWNKDRLGTGYWFRNKHELLLVGTRGNIPAPAMGTQWPSIIDAPVGKHSAKPDKFYELIEEYFPNLPKIELNARRARPGWDCWGNQAPVCTDVDTRPDVNSTAYDPDTGEIIQPEAARDASDSAPESDAQPQPTLAGNAASIEAAVVHVSPNVDAAVSTSSDHDDIPDFLRRKKSVPVVSRVEPHSVNAGDGG